MENFHGVRLFTAVNGAFLTRRWEKPENFMRLTADCGFKCLSFCSDVIDPFFSGDMKYNLKTAEKTRKTGDKCGVKVIDYYTGVATHRFHGLSHSDPAPRAKMRDWIIKSMDIALELGTTRIGGHWDAFSVEVLANKNLLENRMKGIYAQFRSLSKIARRKGISAIHNEQMYIPSEKPWSLKEAREFLRETNKNNSGCPLRLAIQGYNALHIKRVINHDALGIPRNRARRIFGYYNLF